jgi:hypothetical protein
MDELTRSSMIEERIFFIREQHVMIDRDIAELYGIETKVLNQQVKRNMERFPVNFMFRLTENEFHELVTNCDRFRRLKHSAVLPHAFTEQGVSMLSAVLKSKTAINVSIRIINSFVRMRKFFLNNMQLLHRMEQLEIRQLRNEEDVEKILSMIDLHKTTQPKQGVFFDGQIYDAYSFISDLVRSADYRIILIDNYIDDTVLTILDKRKDNVNATIYTSKITKENRLDIRKHNMQYRQIHIREFKKAHDRFLVIDDKVYLIGASIKDLGNKWFGFTVMESISAEELINRLGEL